MNSLTQRSTSAIADPMPPTAPPVHGEMQRLRENTGDLNNVVDALTARLETVLRLEPPADQTAQTRRHGESPLQEGLIDLNYVLEHQLARLRTLIDRLTV